MENITGEKQLYTAKKVVQDVEEVMYKPLQNTFTQIFNISDSSVITTTRRYVCIKYENETQRGMHRKSYKITS